MNKNEFEEYFNNLPNVANITSIDSFGNKTIFIPLKNIVLDNNLAIKEDEDIGDFIKRIFQRKKKKRKQRDESR